FRRHPATTELLILVELGLLRLCCILTGRTNHSDKVQILLIDPELRRVQITSLGANDVDRPTLPRVFPELREVKLQRLQFRGHLRGRRAIDIESQNEKRVLERSRTINLTV